MSSFSERFGYSGQEKEISIREDAPKHFRSAFLEITRKVGKQYWGHPELPICNVVADTLGKPIDPANWRLIGPLWKHVERLVDECDWPQVYDLVEAVHSYFGQINPSAAEQFAEQINDRLVHQGIGWQLVNGKISTRGDAVFENTISLSIQQLTNDNKPTAAQHIKSAIHALSTRPKPNTSGAVAHATSAVECVCGEITGTSTTLGDYLKKHPNLFHPALQKGISSIYGYASDEGARHGREGIEPVLEDAEFVVAICAAACTLLSKRRAQ